MNTLNTRSLKLSPGIVRRIWPFLLVLVAPVAAFGADVYIAEAAAGADSGTSCSNAHSAAWFNSSANWGASAGQIGPGVVAHLCGIITTNLAVQASGASGNPITVLFEPNAKISMPQCPGRGSGCLVADGRSFIIVDGGANGIIENTNSGTGKLQTGSYAIEASPCPNCEIKNLTIQNIYVRTSISDITLDQTTERCITFSGSNVSIHDNVMHDAGWCINDEYGNGDTNVRVYNNNIYNIDHGFTLASGGPITGGDFYFYNNHVHDYTVWDSTVNYYHHDGIHAFGVNVSGYPTVTNFWIYNNLFDGDIGGNTTGHVFLEGGSGTYATPWTGASGQAHIFNNVFLTNRLDYGIISLSKGSGHELYNNTFISGFGPSDGICISITVTSNLKIKNNFISGCNILIGLDAQGTVSVANPATDINNNVYANCAGSYNCWWWNSVDTGLFSTWQSQTGADPNSVNAISTSGGVDSTGHPLAGSSVAGAGANLTSLGIPSLDSDRAGIARPASGAWDAGAYQISSSNLTAQAPSKPIGLTLR